MTTQTRHKYICFISFLLGALIAPGLLAEDEADSPAVSAAPALQVPTPQPLNLPPVPEKFTHPGIQNSMEELQFVKRKIAAGTEPWKTAFEQMKNSKWADLNYKATPHQTIKSGVRGKGGDVGGAGDLSHDSNAAYTQALMWILTDNEQYARNAVQILSDWCILRNHEGGNWYLQASWSGAPFAEAAELLKATYPKWKKEDIARFSGMLNKAFLPILHNQMAYGNREFSTIYAMMAIGIFNDDRGAFYEGLAHFVSYLPAYIYLKEDGPMPKLPNYWLCPPSDEELAKMDAALFPNPVDAWYSAETRKHVLEQMKAKKLGNDHSMLEKPVVGRLWYNAPVEAYVDGLCGETFRDLGHCELSMFSITHITELAWHQGVDLYTPNAKRITSFLELQASLRVGSTVPPCFYSVTPTGMGTSWEVAYNHYHNRKGMALPNTQQVLDKVIRPCLKENFNTTRGWSHFKVDIPGVRSTSVGGFPTWESLTHGTAVDSLLPAAKNTPLPSTSSMPVVPRDTKPAALKLPPMPEKFVHPGLFSSMEELQTLKNKVSRGEDPWKSAFEAMKSSKWADLSYKARPETVCSRGGPQNDDAIAAYTHTLMWILTNNKAHAQKAAEILNAWSSQERGEKENWYMLGTAAMFAEGAELLKATYPQWTREESSRFAAMLNRVYLPVLHNKMAYGDNEFGVIYAMMAIAVFNDDRGAFLEALSHFVSYLPCWIYLKEDGAMPRLPDYWLSSPGNDELAKLDAALFPNPGKAWFSVDVKSGADDRALLEAGDVGKLWNNAPANALIDGLCAQTFNGKGGLGDCDAGFVALSHVAEIAWHQGVDLYTPNAKRITAFMELCSRLRIDDDIPPAYFRIVPGPMCATWESAYNHYHNRKGLDLPWTNRVLQKAVRPCLAKKPITSTGWSYVHPESCGLRASSIFYPALQNCAWETLTHADLF